jgi:hypothetical protein
MSLETLTDPVLFNSGYSCSISDNYSAFESAGSPEGALVMLGPAAELEQKLPWPPDAIDEIAAADETGDPLRYHVAFDGRETTPPAEVEFLTWSVESTDYPLP